MVYHRVYIGCTMVGMYTGGQGSYLPRVVGRHIPRVVYPGIYQGERVYLCAESLLASLRRREETSARRAS